MLNRFVNKVATIDSHSVFHPPAPNASLQSKANKKNKQTKTLQTSEYELACLRLLSRRAKAVTPNDGPKTSSFFYQFMTQSKYIGNNNNSSALHPGSVQRHEYWHTPRR